MENQRISRQSSPTEVQDIIPDFEEQVGEDNGNDSAAAEPEEKTSPAADAESKLEEEMHDLVSSTGDSSLYWYYLKSIGWTYGLLGLFFAVGQTFFTVFDRKAHSHSKVANSANGFVPMQ